MHETNNRTLGKHIDAFVSGYEKGRALDGNTKKDFESFRGMGRDEYLEARAGWEAGQRERLNYSLTMNIVFARNSGDKTFSRVNSRGKKSD